MSLLSIELSTGDVAFYTLLSYGLYKLYTWVLSFITNLYKRVFEDFQKPLVELNNTVKFLSIDILQAETHLTNEINYSTSRVVNSANAIKRDMLMMNFINQLQKLFEVWFDTPSRTPSSTSQHSTSHSSSPFDNIMTTVLANPTLIDTVTKLASSEPIKKWTDSAGGKLFSKIVADNLLSDSKLNSNLFGPPSLVNTDQSLMNLIKKTELTKPALSEDKEDDKDVAIDHDKQLAAFTEMLKNSELISESGDDMPELVPTNDSEQTLSESSNTDTDNEYVENDIQLQSFSFTPEFAETLRMETNR